MIFINIWEGNIQEWLRPFWNRDSELEPTEIFKVTQLFKRGNLHSATFWPSNKPTVQIIIKFYTWLFVLGINLGSASANFLGGIIIRTFNWKIFFYVTGIMGVVWSIFWKYLMYDRPAQHPRISSDELIYLKTVIETTGPKKVKTSISLNSKETRGWTYSLRSDYERILFYYRDLMYQYRGTEYSLQCE